MLTKEKIIQTLEENKSELISLGVKKIALFGSYAKDNQSKDSDLDFLVEFNSGRGLYDDFSKLLIRLKSLFNMDIDLVKNSNTRGIKRFNTTRCTN